MIAALGVMIVIGNEEVVVVIVENAANVANVLLDVETGVNMLARLVSIRKKKFNFKTNKQIFRILRRCH